MAMLNNNNNANYLSKKVQYMNILQRKHRNCKKDNSHTFNIHNKILNCRDYVFQGRQ